MIDVAVIKAVLWYLALSPPVHFCIGAALLLGTSLKTGESIGVIARPTRKKALLAAVPHPMVWLVTQYWVGTEATWPPGPLTLLVIVLAGVAIYYPLASLTIWALEQHG